MTPNHVNHSQQAAQREQAHAILIGAASSGAMD
jgi:hypothetical protein